MTAAINRNRPFVDERGSLTQYGWSVLRDLWSATGGAVATDADDLALLSAGPTVGPIGRAQQGISARVEPVGPPSPVLGQVGPVNGPDAATAADVGPARATADVGRRTTSFGCITLADGSAAEATTDATPRKIAAWATNGLSRNMINDHTSDDIEVLYQGAYFISFTASFEGTNTKHYHMEIYVDSTGSGSVTERTIGASDAGAVSATAILQLVPGEKVSLYHWSPDGGSAFTMTQGTLAVIRLGD